ncbi:hypothetical protein AAG570_010062 [Ranatra chinensis]|uniref:Uncharacterized protein n=1 Tax=Ranatra chinensis TaxID=642074 RepID=A0ABD0Z9T7_9HEMI
MHEEVDCDNEVESNSGQIFYEETMRGPTTQTNEAHTDIELNLTDINREIDSLKEVIRTQCQSMNQFCKMCEDMNIQISRLNHSKQDGLQKNEGIIQMCNNIQKVQVEIDDVVEKAVAIYDRFLPNDQNILTEGNEQLREQCQIDSERRAIYAADKEEIKGKGEFMLEILSSGLSNKGSCLKTISQAIKSLKAQMVNETDAEIVLVSEQISKIEDYKSELEKRMTAVEEELKMLGEVISRMEAEHNNESINLNIKTEEIYSLMNSEKNMIASRNEKIEHLKNMLKELSAHYNNLKVNISKEETAIENVRKEIEVSKLEVQKLEFSIHKINEYLSSSAAIFKQSEECKDAVLRHELALGRLQNELEMNKNEKSILATSIENFKLAIKEAENSHDSLVLDNNKFQQANDLLRSELTEIEFSNKNEKTIFSRCEEAKCELENKKLINNELKSAVENLSSMHETLTNKIESTLKELSNVMEELHTENKKVASTESYLKQREWEQYMQAVNADTMYGRLLQDVEVKTNECKVIRDLIDKIAELQKEQTLNQEKFTSDKKALIESLSKKIESKLIEIRTAQKDLDSDMQEKEEELCQLKQDNHYISCEVETLANLNASNEKYIEQFKCEQNPNSPLKFSEKFGSMDDIFGSSDAEEDEFRASNMQTDSCDSTAMKNAEYRNVATTIPIPIVVTILN